jgi:hypothetical protein
MIDYSISTAQNHGFQQSARTMRQLKPAVQTAKSYHTNGETCTTCNEGQGEKTYTEIGGVYKKLQLFQWQDKAGFLWGDFFVIIISHLLPDNLFEKLYSRH